MGYVRQTGGSTIIVDKETEYGKGLVDEFDKISLQKDKENKEKAKKNYNQKLKEWRKETKKIELENQKRKKEYEKKHENWKKECEQLCKEYEKNLKKWEENCNRSIFGFIKKIFKIHKPKIQLLEEPKSPLYLESKPKPEFRNVYDWL